MSKYDLNNCDYQLIFPDNLKKYKNLERVAKQIENIFKYTIVSKVSKLALLKNLELQDDKVLDKLAYYYSVDNYSFDLKRDIKIELLKNGFNVHSKKGTKSAIKNNLKKLGYTIRIEEWYEYGGKPFTFKVTVVNDKFNADILKNIQEKINAVKNCRSVVDSIDSEVDRIQTYFKMGSFKIIEIEKEYKEE